MIDDGRQCLATPAAVIVIGISQVGFKPVKQEGRDGKVSRRRIIIANALQVPVNAIHLHPDDQPTARLAIGCHEIGAEFMPIGCRQTNELSHFDHSFFLLSTQVDGI